MTTYQEHFDTSCNLRNTYWQSVGALDPDVVAHLINPSFMGGPRWPSLRQAFITVRTPLNTIIASDGLSDPYEDMETNANNAPYNGFGLEVYVKAGLLNGPVQTHWQFQLLYQAAQLMAQQGNVVNLLNDLTYISTEFYDVDVPAEYRNEHGRVGAILGLPDPVIPGEATLTLEPVKMVNVKLLTIPELKYVMDNGEDGRMKLAELLIKEGNPTLSSLERASVV